MVGKEKAYQLQKEEKQNMTLKDIKT